MLSIPQKPLSACAQPSRIFRGSATLVLAASLFLAGCVGVVDPRKAAAPQPKPTPAQSGGASATAPALPPLTAPSLPQTQPSGALTPIGSASIGNQQVATLSAPADIWDRVRRGFAMPDLDSDLVREKEQWYASRPDYMQRMTERSNRYLFHIVEELERRGMPLELALLPFIESAFNPQAVSSARAAGMWQFMPATGQSFDLKQNMFRDDRRDVLASTTAALDYLDQLFNRFGDWHLALAAYNWGQGNVNRAINRNQQAGLPTDYNSLDMPAETRQYVPKLQAVKNIVLKPAAFGVQLPPIGNHPFFDAIGISQDIDVALIIRLADIKEADFHALNPSLKQPVVMASGTPQILLPWENANAFETRLAEHKGPLATWTAWVVPSTLSVEEAAKRLDMSEEELRRVNNIPPRMLVRAGSSLLVRRSAQRNSDVSEHVADNARLSLEPEIVWRKTSVRVRKGESLSELADRFGVSVSSITSLNKKINSKSRLRAGQSVALMLPSNHRQMAGGSSSNSSRVVVIRASTQAKSADSKRAKKSAEQAPKVKEKATSDKRPAAKATSTPKGKTKDKKSDKPAVAADGAKKKKAK